MLENADIPLFNKYVDPIQKLDVYKRTHIYGVTWNDSKGINILRSGLSTADAATVIVYMNTSDTGEKQYKTPKAWKKTPNVDMDKFFTFAPDDIIVKGIIDTDLNITKLADLEKSQDYVYKIKTVDPSDSGSPNLHHWRLGAG